MTLLSDNMAARLMLLKTQGLFQRAVTCNLKLVLFDPCEIVNLRCTAFPKLGAMSTARNKVIFPSYQISLFHSSPCMAKAKSKKEKKIEVIVDARDVEEFIDLAKACKDMLDVVEKLKNDYAHVLRVGADNRLLDSIIIDLQGEKLELREVAKIKKKSNKVIELDFVSFPEAMHPAQIAIQTSNLNLNPSVEGTKLQVPIPAVTAEHRKDLAKLAKKKLNDSKEEIRKIRNSYEKNLKNIENVPKDTDTGIRKQLGVYVNATSAEAENIFKMKEKDLLLK